MCKEGRAGSPCPPVSVIPEDGAGNVRMNVFPSPVHVPDPDIEICREDVMGLLGFIAYEVPEENS